MTESTVTEIGKQVPALLVLAWVVWKFLGALHQQIDLFLQVLGDMQKRQDALSIERSRAVEQATTGCHAFQADLLRRSETVFARMEQALVENSKSNGAISEVIQACVGPRERRQA